MNQVNGAGDTGPLAGWAIVQAHGMILIGKLSLFGGDSLSPVFELRPMMGDRGIGHLIVPVWLLGVDRLDIPKDAISHPCEMLSRRQRVALLQATQQAEAMTAAMRAAESGITLAPEHALRGLRKP